MVGGDALEPANAEYYVPVRWNENTPVTGTYL
jgi:hypothetical protein